MSIKIKEKATPVAPEVGKIEIYLDQADGKLKSINNSSTEAAYNTEADSKLVEKAEPASPVVGAHELYIDSADQKLKSKDNAGTVTEYVALGGGGGAGVSGIGVIVGDVTDVGNGDAQFSSIGAAITASTAGDRITLLSRVFTENITIDKSVSIIGYGNGSVIDGTTTFLFGDAPVASAYTGTPAGAGGVVTIDADIAGAAGDLITITGDGILDVQNLINVWNAGNGGNTATVTAGGAEVITLGEVVTLTGGANQQPDGSAATCQRVKFTDDVTVEDLVTKVMIVDSWLASGKNIIDNNSNTSVNMYALLQE